MPITMNDLTISPQGIDMENLLNDWTWAMPEPLYAVLLTAMGDVFAQGETGAIYFVDTVGGKVRCVANDADAFQALLRDHAFVTENLFPTRLVQYRKAGLTLGPQQVYSHKQLLVLGGDDDLDNIEATDVSVHVSVAGQIHRQVKDLPDGTPISEIQFE